MIKAIVWVDKDVLLMDRPSGFTVTANFDKPADDDTTWIPLYTHPVKQEEDGYFLPMNVLNEPMQKSIKALIDHAKKGRWSNAIVRQDGVETTYEADWIKSLVPVTHPVKQLSDEEIDKIENKVYLQTIAKGKPLGNYSKQLARAIIKEITE